MTSYAKLFSFVFAVLLINNIANASNIPKCDDRRVLQWVEDTSLERTNLPRDKVDLKLENLSETSSTPNERACEVTLRLKRSPTAQREIDGFSALWKKEAGGAPEPWYLQHPRDNPRGYYLISFVLRHDLIRKEWFGKYQIKNSLDWDLNAYKEARRLFASDFEYYKLRIAKEQEREAARLAKIEKEEREHDTIMANNEFMECFRKNYDILYENAGPRDQLNAPADVIVRISIIDGIVNKTEIIESSGIASFGKFLRGALRKINCRSEGLTGSFKFRFTIG